MIQMPQMVAALNGLGAVPRHWWAWSLPQGSGESLCPFYHGFTIAEP